MKKVLISVFVVAFATLSVLAQNYKKTLKKADELYDQFDYNGAIPLYLEVLKVEPDNVDANFKLGHSYLKTTYNHKAEQYLEKAYRLDPDFDPDLRLDLAIAYHIDHKFEEAIKYFEREKAELNPKKDVDRYKEVEKHIYECQNAIEFIKNPLKVTITNVGDKINGKFPDFVPVISADRSVMVFTSRRETNIGTNEIDENGNETFKYEDLYISKLNGKNWSYPTNMGRPVNTESHDACVSLSADGTKLFMYNADRGNGDLFVSELVGDKWTKPEPLSDNINSKYYEPHVSMTADEQTLYFSSERPGGFGGLDIYMSKKLKNGKWGDPVNLGSKINTEYDEDAPFIHADGKTLYFSSKGHKTMGGFDIFTSVLLDGKWSTPENIGYPINTADHDIYFVISADKKYGYYASAMDGTYGEKDIYEIKMPEPKKIESASTRTTTTTNTTVNKTLIAPAPVIEAVNPITVLKGNITDALTKAPIDANIVIVDNTKNEIVAEMHANAATGHYLVILPSGKNYGIAVQKQDYLFHSENFDIPSSTDYQEIVKDVQLKKVAVGTKIVLRNIFFDFDKATLRPESTAELERLTQLLTELPNLKIEISGHTDDKGSDEYNKTLSQRRAKAVLDYLVAKGISASRLQSAGYGEERPIDTNETDEGRQQNRRTEFEIIGN